MCYHWDQNDFGLSSLYITYELGDFGHIEGTRGIPHAMEHLICKRIDDIDPKLTSLGIQWNAYTSTSHVVFHFDGLAEKLELVIQEIHDRLINPDIKWSEESFKNEMSTVIQEYRDVFNDQQGGTIANNSRIYYNSADAIGLIEDIESFTYDDSLLIAEFFNIPSKIIQSGMKKQVTYDYEFVRRDPTELRFRGSSSLPLEKIPTDKKSYIELISNKSYHGSRLLRLSGLANYCLCDGLQSPLYQEIRVKRGLAYAVYCYSKDTPINGFSRVSLCTTNENVKEATDVLKEFFSGDAGRHITDERFSDCKQFFEIYGKKRDILVHSSVKRFISEFDENDVSEFTIEDVKSFINEYIHMDNFILCKN